MKLETTKYIAITNNSILTIKGFKRQNKSFDTIIRLFSSENEAYEYMDKKVFSNKTIEKVMIRKIKVSYEVLQ